MVFFKGPQEIWTQVKTFFLINDKDDMIFEFCFLKICTEIGTDTFVDYP